MSKHGKNGKNGKPSREDAHLMIQLYEAQATHQIPDAMSYIWSNDFPATFEEFRQKFPQGGNSSQERQVYRALGYYETIGTLYRNGLVNEDLLFDWLAIDAIWDRLRSFVEGLRAEVGQSRFYENFEYMAARNGKWKPNR
jgi:hypothetical protein